MRCLRYYQVSNLYKPTSEGRMFGGLEDIAIITARTTGKSTETMLLHIGMSEELQGDFTVERYIIIVEPIPTQSYSPVSCRTQPYHSVLLDPLVLPDPNRPHLTPTPLTQSYRPHSTLSRPHLTSHSLTRPYLHPNQLFLTDFRSYST